MLNVNRETKLNIGDCLYYKNVSNIHPLATYLCKVVDIKPHVIIVRMKPIMSTMGEKTYIDSFSRTYNHAISKNEIGTEDVSLKLDTTDFDIPDPENEAKLICDKFGVKFLEMVGKYGFKYQNRGNSFLDKHVLGDVYEDDIRFFYMEEAWDLKANNIAC